MLERTFISELWPRITSELIFGDGTEMKKAIQTENIGKESTVKINLIQD